MVELPADDAADITIQHRLRECLQRHRPGQEDSAATRVPVVALVRDNSSLRYVRLGPQFCVDNPTAALATLSEASFAARVSSPLLAA